MQVFDDITKVGAPAALRFKDITKVTAPVETFRPLPESTPTPTYRIEDEATPGELDTKVRGSGRYPKTLKHHSNSSAVRPAPIATEVKLAPILLPFESDDEDGDDEYGWDENSHLLEDADPEKEIEKSAIHRDQQKDIMRHMPLENMTNYEHPSVEDDDDEYEHGRTIHRKQTHSSSHDPITEQIRQSPVVQPEENERREREETKYNTPPDFHQQGDNADQLIQTEMDQDDLDLQDAPITLAEIMGDELMYRAIKPLMKRGPPPSPSPSPSPSPGPEPLPKRHRKETRPKTPLPLPQRTPTPVPRPAVEDPPARMGLPLPSDPGSSDDSDADDMNRYRHPRDNITLSEFATITHHYLHRRHHLTDSARRDMRDFQDGMKRRRKTLKMIARMEAQKKGRELSDHRLEFLDEQAINQIIDIALHDKYELHTLQIRRSKPLIYESTGLRVDLHHRCPKGCKAFNDAEELTCDYCGSNRYKADGITPTATYPYIRLLPRLRLWFSDQAFVEMMCNYTREAIKEKKEQTDYWNSGDYKEKKAKGMFKDPHQRDLAFLLTTDELTPFKSKSYYRVTPMVLACYNLPSHIRFKTRFLLVAGFIPGRTSLKDCPKGKSKPQDRDSFFEPLVRELEALAKGVNCYDSLDKKDFILRAFLVLIGADMVERAELLGKLFCEYCRSIGVKFGAIYTPTTAPTNAPAWLLEREERLRAEGKAAFDFSDMANDIRRNHLNTLARTPAHIQRCYRFLSDPANSQDKAFRSLHGIKKVSIFSRLESITIPFSFPPDLMHLFCNVGKLMVEIYNGSIFQKGTGKDDVDNDAAPNNRPNNRRGRRRPGDDEFDTDGELSASDEENVPLNEDFIIPKNVWGDIGRDQLQSRKSIPISIGEVDDINSHSSML